MHYEPQDGKWQLGDDAQLLFELRKKMTPEAYEEEKSRSRSFFAATFRPANAVILRGVPFRP